MEREEEEEGGGGAGGGGGGGGGGEWEMGKGKREDQSNKDYKGPENITRNTNSTGNTMVLNLYISIIILNVNAPIKRHRVSE